MRLNDRSVVRAPGNHHCRGQTLPVLVGLEPDRFVCFQEKFGRWLAGDCAGPIFSGRHRPFSIGSLQ
jgi:hypothetical protein